MVQWLKRLCAPNAGGLGSIPGEGIRSHMLQIRPSAARLKTKTKTVEQSAQERDGASEFFKVPGTLGQDPTSSSSLRESNREKGIQIWKED